MVEEVQGQQSQSTPASEFNLQQFLITQRLAKINTVFLVRVVKVTAAGEVAEAPAIDVLPLVNQMTGDRQSVPHAVVHGVPYYRLQGGSNAVIMDPVVGDIGICGCASRDISAVKVAKGPANPGSERVFDWADALYFGGVLNAAPTQYVRFFAGGIEVVSPTQITLRAPIIELAGAVQQTTADASSFTGALSAEGTDVHAHLHGGVQSGGSNTGPPV